MLTGVEAVSDFQPTNIGSSEGILRNQVVFDRDGTPKSTDYIIHIDVLFKEGEGRNSGGIASAHRIADMVLNEIREKIKIVLIKIVSGLGNMYDTSVFPFEPGGFIGSKLMRNSKNIPYVITGNQCKDGAIHLLLQKIY